jgi:predicted metal-dependent enzyme (double-stranded beta helix superfamily)
MSAVAHHARPVEALARLGTFVAAIGALLDRTDDEREILATGRTLLAALVARDDWLPDAYAQPDPARYRQYLLYRDPDARFSVVSFVWAPGQATPIHDHGVWGLVGVLRGAEIAERFERGGGALRPVGSERLEARAVDAVSPRIGDLHRVSNADADGVSISIHVYGADIGAVERATYDPAGNAKRFVSGYADAPVPQLDGYFA